jgi:hypothetical protein
VQDEIDAGGLVTAQQAALEFRDQQSARLRRELTQVVSQPFDGFDARNRRPIRIAIARFDNSAGVSVKHIAWAFN